MTQPAWKDVLDGYSPEDQQKLEWAAADQAERIEKAALDLSATGVVDGINIEELWPFVLRRREELVAGVAEAPVEAPVEPAEEEAAQDPSNDVPEAEEAAVEAPVEEEAPKPAPKPRTPRAKKTT